MVGCLGKAANGGCLNNCLADLDEWLAHFDLDLRIQAPQVIEHLVKVKLTCAHNDMLSRLLDLGLDHGVALVDFAKTLDHFRKLARIEWLTCDLNGGLRIEIEFPERLHVALVDAGNSSSLRDACIDAFDRNPVAGICLVNLNFEATTGLQEPKFGSSGDCDIFLILIEGELLSQDFHFLALGQGS